MRFIRSALATLLLMSCSTSHVPLPAVTAATDATASIARGEYIVRTVSSCSGCHAADRKNPDSPLSGGAEFRDWRIGTARGSNLTSDVATGLGSWSEAEIVRALRNGERKDGRLLAPVMPYEWYHEMSDGDAFAVARYLKSLPPVRNEVTQSPSFWFKLGKLFLGPKPAIVATAPPRGATPEYGAYLAQHVGLCADCHTQRTGLMQKPDKSRLFAGMSKPPKDFPMHPANLTADLETGIGKWSEADFVKAMRTGVTPEGEKLNSFMPWPAFKQMSDDDLRAIYLFLRTLPPIHNNVD